MAEQDRKRIKALSAQAEQEKQEKNPEPKPRPASRPTPAPEPKPEPLLPTDFPGWLRAAEQGDAEAMCCVAMRHFFGKDGAEKNDEQALFWAKKAKESGKLPTKIRIDLLIRDIEGSIAFCAGVKAAREAGDFAEALRQYRISAEKGNSAAAYNLGILYFKGQGTEKDEAESFRWFLRSAEMGNPYAMYWVAKRHYFGEDGAEKNDEQALFWAKKAKETGKLSADKNIDQLIRDIEVHIAFCADRAASKDFSWERKAAESGNANAMYAIASCYCSGDYITKEHETTALQWARRAKESGRLSANKDVDGLIRKIEGRQAYRSGCDARSSWNFILADQLFREAAEKGDDRAFTALERLYDRWSTAIGTRDGDHASMRTELTPAELREEAFRWRLRAAEKGSGADQISIGNVYYNGDKSRSIPVDKAKAAEWYEKAADQRSISAQYKLGMMYYSGDGVPENKAKAAEWFIKAADKGHPDAKEMLRRFSEQFKIWIY